MDGQKIIDLTKIVKTLLSNKKVFIKTWIVTFILSCIWILPQPRFYTCDVKLAPEISGEDYSGGLAGIASSYGINLGSTISQDAIYPDLYPELFESPEFIVGLLGVQVTAMNKELTTDYFTYMKKHQKKNLLTWPFMWTISKIRNLFMTKETTVPSNNPGSINPFMMSRKDYALMQIIMQKIRCSVDKKTSVITINVKDQDPLVCATMADSVKAHLQNFIIGYRTSKAAEDVVYYKQMCDSAEREFDAAMQAYNRFCETHNRVAMQSYLSERSKLENELALKQNSLVAMETQLQSTKMKLQEKTPAFTTLKSATVPVKPAGPKRMVFVIMMLFFASFVCAGWLCRNEIF